MAVCAACGHSNPDGARFCNACAAELAPTTTRREERKVVTVVFADLVGSTARAEHADPEDVRAVLAPYHARLRHELERFGGTVEKFIGDAVVAVFGAPVVHEDDPERAVRAALAIQDAIAELNEADPALALQVRVGVNTGEALVTIDASPAEGEGMVAGDVINTGARLQAAAGPGGVLVGDATYRATDRVIDYEQVEPVTAKGKAEPVVAWRAVAPRARFGVDLGGAGRGPLVGRDRETSLLATALERVRAEHEPQLVTLVGVPGIGKSRLVQELWRLVDADEQLIVWRQGRSLPYGEGVAFWALGEMVKAQAGILESDSSEVASAKLERAATDLLADDRERAWVARHLRPLVGLAADVAGRGDEHRAEAAAAWRRFLEAIAEQGPTVLVFEDLHWADDGLLEFVDALADRVSGVPLLVVGTGRPELLERRPGWGGGMRNAQTVSLQALSDEDTARLLQALLERSALSASTQSALLRNAGGVPLFAEEFARMLGTGAGGDAVPQTLQGIVVARIDGLPEEEKQLLHHAAVLGKVFWTDGLAAMGGDEPRVLDDLLHGLERKEFLRRERRSSVEGARQYAFVHALVHDAAYGQIPRVERARAHRLAAEWIASLPGDRSEDRAEVLAHHLGRAIEYGTAAGLPIDDLLPDAVRAFREAGDRAWALGALREAARFYRAALERAGADADPQLLFLLGRSLVYTENAGEEELTQAVDGLLATGDVETAAEALIALHEVRWVGGSTGTALLEQASELIGDETETRAGTYVIGSLGRFYGLAGRSAEAVALDERAMAGAQRIGDRRLYAWALNNRGVARSNLGDEAGIADLERALEISLEIGSVDVGRCRINLGSVLDDRGDLDAAWSHLSAGLEFAQAIGIRRFERIMTSELARNRLLSGRWDEALDLAATFANDVRDGYHESELRGVSIVIAAERGEPLDLEDISRVSQRAHEIGDFQVLIPWLAAMARALATAGEAAEATASLEELVRTCRGDAATYLRGSWFYDAAVAAALVGGGTQLLEVAHRDRATRWGQAAVALLSGDPLQAAETLEAMGAFDEAGARLTAAEGFLEAGRDDEATTQAERALAIYRSLAAAPGIARAEAIAGVAR